jgi:exodeoxyribonuclease VII small subunit
MIDENMTFEEALAQLEQVVSRMEQGDYELEKLVDAYSRGMALERFARKKLEDMKKKIEVLVSRSSDQWEDFAGSNSREHNGDLL